MKTFLTFCIAMMLCACARPDTVKTTEPSVPTPSPQPVLLQAEAVLAGLIGANLPIVKEVVYTDETDTNHLLGRPNQYTGKINFEDSRIKKPTVPLNNSIEVFANSDDLEARRKYVEAITKAVSPLAQYSYVHKNVFLRLDHTLTPAQAKEYEAALKSL